MQRLGRRIFASTESRRRAYCLHIIGCPFVRKPAQVAVGLPMKGSTLCTLSNACRSAPHEFFQFLALLGVVTFVWGLEIASPTRRRRLRMHYIIGGTSTHRSNPYHVDNPGVPGDSARLPHDGRSIMVRGSTACCTWRSWLCRPQCTCVLVGRRRLRGSGDVRGHQFGSNLEARGRPDGK